MRIFRKLLFASRGERLKSRRGLSRRDALFASIGGAIPFFPSGAAARSSTPYAQPHLVTSRAELAALPPSTQAALWGGVLYVFTSGNFSANATLHSLDYVVSTHPNAAEGAWVRQAHEPALISRVSSAARTLQSKSLDIYSVNDMGAVGDGKTDNTEFINAAILEVHSGGGGEIIFGCSPAPYYVKGPIIIPSNIILNLSGQTLSGDGFNGGIMFTTGTVKDGNLVSNKGTSDEADFVFYSSIRNGMIRNCAIAFELQNFNISCSIEDISTFEVLQFGVFDRCFYMSLLNCSARGPSDPAKPAFSFTQKNNLISLLRVSATMDSGFLFAGGTSSVSMIACSCEGGGGSAVSFRDDCLGIVVDSGYWEAIGGVVFDFTKAKVCSISFRSNYINYCDTIIDDGGERSESTLFGVFDDTNYVANIDQKYQGVLYRGRMIANCPRNFIRFEIPFSDSADGTLPANWTAGASSRIQRETSFTGRSLADVRSKSRLYYRGIIPMVREGDVGDPWPGLVDRSRISIPKGIAVTATVDSAIAWRPNSVRATFTLAVSDDSGTYKIFGDIYGDQLIQQDRSGRRTFVVNRGGFLSMRLLGVDNRSGKASITGSLQLCT